MNAIADSIGQVRLGLIAWYALMSVAAFVMYARDKAAAERGGWRTPESRLHLVSLAGGWPGALIAQRTFRHKTRKQPFRAIFWGTVVANLVALLLVLGMPILTG